MTVDEARALMHEWVKSEALRAHMEAVAACVGAYAKQLEPDRVAQWTVCGLLHDFDYEKHPTAEEHPFLGVEELARLGVDEEIREAILGHADYSGTPRTTALSKVLYACDELAGFIVACCKVRPNGVGDLEPRSVKKKLKDKAFASNVSREDIARGMTELSELYETSDVAAFETQHIQTCIDALRSRRELLGV
jgi:putative nucleotidyltransferase with HDIG domain